MLGNLGRRREDASDEQKDSGGGEKDAGDKMLGEVMLGNLVGREGVFVMNKGTVVVNGRC